MSQPRGTLRLLAALCLASLCACGVLRLLRPAPSLPPAAARSSGGSRRLLVASPSFSLAKPTGGSLPDVSASSASVSVVAGPAYASLTITATGGLGSTSAARAKLVDFDSTDCAAASARTVAPLDGSGAPSAHSGTSNTFSSVVFTQGGVFRICYKENAGASFQLLGVNVTVAGASSSTASHFCFASSSFSCRIRLSGTDLASTYTVGVVAAGGTCGSSALDTSAFGNAASQVTAAESTDTLQVHNFSVKQNVVAATYVLCLCPNFDADNSGGACQSGSAADFAQAVGTLYVTTVTPSITNVFNGSSITNVYNGLTFGITVDCGASVGGCTTTSSNRIKIVEDAAANDVDAWNSTSGCGAALETPRQVSPANCQNAIDCWHAPTDANAVSPTWQGLLFEGRILNRQYAITDYDVCYCDGGCLDPSRWFKVGELRVKPVRVQGPSLVNHAADVQLIGTMGSWTTNGSAGVREMKLLSDATGVVGADECFEVTQSTQLVGGHTCSSSRDCGSPTYNTFGQTYSSVVVKVPGWVAVCYCDSACESRIHWFVFGRIGTAGPWSGQGWSFYTDMVFQLELRGWRLSTDNRIRIISDTRQCTESILSDSAVVGPSPATPTQLAGSVGDITSFAAVESGTEVTFAAQHGLEVDALIIISGVRCSSCADDVKGMFNTEHKVKNVTSPTKIVIDVTFPSGSYPAMTASTGSWRRADAQTYAGLSVYKAGRYSICWSASSAAAKSESFTAGSLLVTDAPVMASQLYLSTIEPNRIAPVVVKFTTSDNKRYHDAVGPMQLRITFASPGMLAPAFYDGSLATPDAQHDTLAEATQTTCGKFALELGTNGGLGFPMPQGCYYRQEGIKWEFFIVFHRGNGLAPSTTYEIVMLAQVLSGLTGEAVQVWSLDDVENKPYDVLEIGRAHASKAAASVVRQATDPAFDPNDGVTLLGGDSSGTLELSRVAASFQVRLKATSSTPIKATNIVRFFLQPFTQWHVGSACSASCTPQSGSTCDRSLTCFTESLMGDWVQKNVMKVVLPTGMTDITDAVQHTVAFTALTTPSGGFFPTRWSAELQAVEGTRPHYVSVSGSLVYVQPKVTTASLVSTAGDGNLRPFRGDQGNELFLKIVLGASLFAASSGDATMTIGMPSGYSSSGVVAAPESLNLLSSQVPSGRGDLTVGGAEGTWEAISPLQYRFNLGARKVLYAGSSIFLRIYVDNPSVPLEQGSSGNVWTLQLVANISSGNYTYNSSKLLPPTPFAGSGVLAGSLPVLGKLTEDVIMPSDFSTAATRNWLSIFFRTEQEVGSGGSIWVEAPDSFDFGAACEVRDLPQLYYERFDPAAAETRNSTFTLPVPFATTAACVGEKVSQTAFSFNRAKIPLSGALSGWVRFGFQVRVANAKAYYSADHSQWRLWTYSPAGTRLDGSPESVPMNTDDTPGPGKSWGVYDYMLGPSSFQVAIADTRPTGLTTDITVFPLTFLADTSSTLRIIAPAGYQWSFAAGEFVYRMQNGSLSPGAYVPGAEADMPLSAAPQAPIAAPLNVLEIANLTGEFRRRVKYGFLAKIVVPSRTPTGSLNSFVLEVGAQSGRTQAGLAEAPLVQRVVDVTAFLTSSAVSQDGVLTLRFRTMTSVPAGGGLTVAGPAGFQGIGPASSSACNLSSVDATPLGLPSYSCSLANSSSGSSNWTLTLTSGGVLRAGSYQLVSLVRNPSTPMAVSWQLTTYTNLSAPSPEALDYTGVAPSLDIRPVMAGASLVSGGFCLQEALSNCAVEDRQYQRTGRNDRPGERNNLIFSFSLASNSSAGSFMIIAPAGFTWAAQCSVVWASADVFGAFGSLPSNFSAWPENVTATQCRGQGNMATFQVDHPPGLGFVAGRRYIFRIDWVVNPAIMSAGDTWTVQFSGEASLPFPGFTPWSLRSTELEPLDAMEGVSNTVYLRFKLHNAIPAEGYLHIQAPRGFMIPLQCQLQIQEGLLQESFLPTNYRCEGIGETVNGVVQPTSAAKVLLLSRALQVGESYTIQLSVQNPAVATPNAEPWSVRTYRRLTWISAQATYEALDSSTLSGFRIFPRLGMFRLDRVPAKNGLAQVSWEFIMQFKEQVFATDIIEFLAPRGYSIQAGGSSNCSQHQLLLGALAESSAQCTGPCYRTATCTDGERGVMRWQLHRCPSYQGPAAGLEGLCLPAESTLRFKLATQNPETTPAANYFNLRHTDLHGKVLSSGTHGAYQIVPLLTNVGVEPYSFAASSTLSESVGSQSTIRLNFTTRTEALTITIFGGVGGSSFRFSAARAYDAITGQELPVHERDAVHVVLSMRQRIPANTAVSIVLTLMQNAPVNGISTWAITTYDQYNTVMGPLGIADQRLDAVGFPIAGYVSVLTSSVLSPVYYGSRNASAILNFRSSVLTRAGEEVMITAPRNYVFESPLVSGSGGLQPVDLIVQNAPANFTGAYARDSSSTAVSPVFVQAGGAQFLYWHQASGQWVISPSAGRAATGLVGEAVLTVAGSALGGSRPAVIDAAGSWRVGNGTSWLPAPDMSVLMEGQLTLGERRLVLKLAEDLPAETEAQVLAKVALPSAEQNERNWLFEARAVNGELVATNDEQFMGFALLWPISFLLVPALHAPRARSALTLRFDQARRIQGLAIPFPTSVRFELAAPAPLASQTSQDAFNFPQNCLSATELSKADRLFVQCAGSTQTASLTSTDPRRIWGAGLTVELLVDFPLATPLINEWSLTYFIQGSTVRSAHGTTIGFSVVPMTVQLQGNNQLGMQSNGYFRFRPSSNVMPGWELRITAPVRQSYQVTCWQLNAGSLPKAPACSKLLIEEALALTIPEGGMLIAGRDYTVGVRITNPHSVVPQLMNMWSMVVRDQAGNIQDANYAVQGSDLQSLKITAPETITLVRQGSSTSTATLVVTFGHAVTAGTLSHLLFTPPSSFRISRNKTSSGLPLSAPPRMQGDALLVPLSSSAQVPQGKYFLEVSGSEQAAGLGASGSWAGVWLFQAFRSGGELSFQQALAGTTGDKTV